MLQIRLFYRQESILDRRCGRIKIIFWVWLQIEAQIISKVSLTFHKTVEAYFFCWMKKLLYWAGFIMKFPGLESSPHWANINSINFSACRIVSIKWRSDNVVCDTLKCLLSVRTSELPAFVISPTKCTFLGRRGARIITHKDNCRFLLMRELSYEALWSYTSWNMCTCVSVCVCVTPRSREHCDVEA